MIKCKLSDRNRLLLKARHFEMQSIAFRLKKKVLRDFIGLMLFQWKECSTSDVGPSIVEFFEWSIYEPVYNQSIVDFCADW